MKVEVVAIGTELLLGQIVDTNSSWIGEQLALAGLDSHYQTKVGDNPARIREVLELALSRSDAVICCGGLGPTQDDLTRDVIAEVMGVELVRDDVVAERIAAMFASRGRPMPENNLRQAMVPVGARIIPQQPGTAPGLICPVGDGPGAKVVYAVPGVPYEMKTMVNETIIGDLIERSGERAVIRSRVLRTWGTSESGLAEMLADRIDELDHIGNPTIAFLASGVEGLKVRVTAKAPDEATAGAVLDAEEAGLRQILGSMVFGLDDANMETVVVAALAERGLTVAVAESVTGGYVVGRLCAVPGAGDVVRGAIVAYDHGLKQTMLGLPEGPVVTEEAVLAMARGARERLGADVGLATTGVAGPEELEGRPVGDGVPRRVDRPAVAGCRGGRGGGHGPAPRRPRADPPVLGHLSPRPAPTDPRAGGPGRQLIDGRGSRPLELEVVSESTDPFTAPFGTLFGDHMTMATMADGVYAYPGSAQPVENLSLHPGTHVLHYSSSCFEGLKAHRQIDGRLAIFRLDDHVARMCQSVERLSMPAPDAELIRTMIVDAVEANASSTPPAPGSLYIRPTLIGTLLNIGAAAAPSNTALLYVLTSPVGDYFAGGIRPLTIYIETSIPRTTPQFGMVKSGANYVMALGPTLEAKRGHDADQVLFATGGDVTETGAANFFLVDGERVITRNLDESFLHGVTRASVLTIAADLGYEVEERSIPLDELRAWSGNGEAFLSGTAAVLAPVGTVLVDGESVTFGDGQPGPNTLRLREALTDIQLGKAPDAHGWCTFVTG